MLLLRTTLAGLICLANAAAEPEVAVVGPAGAVLRSGPERSYYATQRLDPGAGVEVYERLPNGYCAIRPPESAFSWIPKSDVELFGQVGTVTRAGVASRVGSVLAPDQRDAVHVRLEAGEQVRVIGVAQIDATDWLKIAPPAGEFRWVQASELSFADGELPTVEQSSSGWVTTTVLEEEAPPLAEAAPNAQVAPTKNFTPIELPADASFAQRLAVLEVRLARTVAEPANLWRFEAIESAAATLLAQATNEDERAAIRSLAERTDRFAAFANRYRTNRAGPLPNDNLAAPRRFPAASGKTQVTVEEVEPTAVNIPGYDAVGALRQVVSSRPGFPGYALVGEDGKIVTLLTPGADLNLQPLVGKRVGVRGVRGFMPEYQQQHVTASRVTPVETMRR